MENAFFEAEMQDQPETEESYRKRVLSNFGALYPDDELSTVALAERHGGDTLRCRHCSSKNVEKDDGGRFIKCMECWKKTWLTAGTFFEYVKRPRAWLAAIWLREHGVFMSASEFHKLFGIALSSALNIFKKLGMVIDHDMNQDVLAISSRIFRQAIGKRSRLTPAREHPIAEQDECEKEENGESGDCRSASGSSASESLSSSGGQSRCQQPCQSQSAAADVVDVDETTGLDKKIYDLLSREPVDFAALCQRTSTLASELLPTITMLQLKGLVMQVSGNKYVRAEPVRKAPAIHSLSSLSAAQTKKIVDSVVEFIRGKFHGISRKYLQLFLAEYWCYMDRGRWRPGMLLSACQQFDRVSDKDVLEYESPAMASVAICL
jgi:DprA winged helix domain